MFHFNVSLHLHLTTSIFSLVFRRIQVPTGKQTSLLYPFVLPKIRFFFRRFFLILRIEIGCSGVRLHFSPSYDRLVVHSSCRSRMFDCSWCRCLIIRAYFSIRHIRFCSPYSILFAEFYSVRRILFYSVRRYGLVFSLSASVFNRVTLPFWRFLCASPRVDFILLSKMPKILNLFHFSQICVRFFHSSCFFHLLMTFNSFCC